MLAKKKTFVVLGVVVVTVISMLVWTALTITEPYIVKPMASSPAPVGATVGHSVSSGSRTLSIVSSNDVVVVADPGASFRYEVIWLVERPRKDGANTLVEYKCELPKYAAADHINSIGSLIPPKIQQIADGGKW